MILDTIYKAEVLKSEDSKGSGHTYIGMASGDFKACYRNHTKSFRIEKYEKETELSKFVWQLKRKNVEFKVNFEILSQERPYEKETGKCPMCTREKLEIVKHIKRNGSKSLNRRWEAFRKCLHRSRHLLGTINTRLKEPEAGIGEGEGNGHQEEEGEGAVGGERVATEEGEEQEGHRGQEIPLGQTRSGRQFRDNG